MGWIFIDDKKGGDSEEMRSQMRDRMTAHKGGRSSETSGGRTFEDGYRSGYKHGWEDAEDEADGYRRSRDSRGRFM